jgi:HEAT repeat protein
MSTAFKMMMTVLVLMLALASRSQAYVDLAPTLAKVISDAQTISIVEVDKFSAEKGAAILKKVRDIKGKLADGPIKHQLSLPNQPVARQILEWAEPGSRGVLMVSSETALMCMGRTWYQAQASADGWWTVSQQRPELPLAYCGTVSRLGEAAEQMVAGKTAIITVLAHGENDEAASFDLALNRTSLPGLVKLMRLRANLKMPQMVMAASTNASYLVGPGPVGEEEVPALIGKLGSADAITRAETAEDLGTLGAKAANAAEPLAKLLEDPSPRVRTAAAAALAQIDPNDKRAVGALTRDLGSSDVAVRRHAASATGLAGAAAAPLAPKLAALLSDSDEATRRFALQSIATLGPAASDATAAVTKLLDDPQTSIDAADALGRIGKAARPSMKKLATLISSNAPAARWAAVRAMSQIGGPDAKPAVDFMIREMPKAPELDGYNMMIYLALCGPVAKDAISAVQNSSIRQPALKPATIWAIQPDKGLPWGNGGGFMQDGEVVRFIYQSYVSELGDRLRPASLLLAKKIADGTAGNPPMWAYRLLDIAPDEVIAILTPGLESKQIIQRERSVVALGYMGAAAAPAKEKIAAALAIAATEREQRLIKWCLKEISTSAATASR